MEHIKLICLAEKCIILNPDQKPTKAFITNLTEQLRCVYKDYVKINGVASMRMLYQKNTQVTFSQRGLCNRLDWRSRLTYLSVSFRIKISSC